MRDIKPEKKTTAPQPLPCHDDLTATLETALSYLERAAADRKSPLHTPVLATIGLDGTPRTRMVVLRRTDIANRSLIFHTDTRSAKISELANSPEASLLFYDPKKNIQISVSGPAKELPTDQRDAEWQRLHPGSKTVYQVEPSPGTKLTSTAQAKYTPQSNQDGYQHFTALTVSIAKLEWLYLAAVGHRRALFRFETSGPTPEQLPEMQWLSP